MLAIVAHLIQLLNLPIVVFDWFFPFFENEQKNFFARRAHSLSLHSLAEVVDSHLVKTNF